jgi:hypothetical protein
VFLANFAVKKVLFDNVRITKLVIGSGAKQSGIQIASLPD